MGGRSGSASATGTWTVNLQPTVSASATHVVASMPRAKDTRHVVATRVDCDDCAQLKVAPSPKTPKQTRAERLRVSFSPKDTVHHFSVRQGDLDERREHWHKILDAAALYNSDEDDEFDGSDEETVDSVVLAVAAVTSTASTEREPETPNSASRRRSILAAGLNDDEAPRYTT